MPLCENSSLAMQDQYVFRKQRPLWLIGQRPFGKDSDDEIVDITFMLNNNLEIS